ncbi:GPI-anchor transamidase [Babesia microti strain RI]|uniref:GPI-anchor transamidase n=1 Tax=Babesia microti (strain RI) TaxID=1133968 RepID=A0A1N6LY33_BABMR|nr:GPI-anchor transamidase [Babesia microti strain RI]SIO73788.1 GPI-anchor transamidase [Babesia microti strain RI]|eukprot:XP_012650207.2 GPI-anchor transamidase [Babesia microti strain RI]
MIIFIFLYIAHSLIVFAVSNIPTIVGPDIYELNSELALLKSLIVTSDPESFEYKKAIISYNKLSLDKQIKYTESDSIVISTSRHFYNYRHAGNVFSIVSILRHHGGHSINQSQIILPDDHICCPINCLPGKLYIESDINDNVTGDLDNVNVLNGNLNRYGTIINYRRDNLDKNKLRYIITQRYPPFYPRIARSPFRTNVFWAGVIPKPNLLFYITGHGGDRYMQINHREFVLSQEVNVFFSDINIKNVYSRFLLLVDTCQSSTFVSNIDNRIPMGWITSSIYGQSSFSLHNNPKLAVTNVDQFTYYLSHYLKDICGAVKDGVARAAISRLSTSSIKRYLARSFITSTVVSKNLTGLYMSNDPHYKPNSQSSNANDNANDTEKMNLYLGQFVFNYRTVYGNSHILPLHYKWERDLEPNEHVRHYNLNNIKAELFKELQCLSDEILKDIEVKNALGHSNESMEVGIHAGDDYRNQYTSTFGHLDKSINYTNYVIYPLRCRNKLWYYKIKPRPEIKKYHPSYSLLGQYYSFPDQKYLSTIGTTIYTDYTNLSDKNYLERAPLYLTLLIYLSIACNLALYYQPSIYS